ncbi:hypothetical protein CHCC14821_1287 [Bacillus paralicheniformis]|nr:hypothetical protein CHCC14821_1287 [Bacillus paralicheniformis]TWM54134.1 hypothetical protein CHCC14814_2942 [Bacillus paralicheniformis]
MKRNEYERMTARGETDSGKPKSGAEGASWGTVNLSGKRTLA